jgi:hypothetical protein
LRFLLDENLPLQLNRRLIAAGFGSEHIITLGQRGLPDAEILARLAMEDDLVLVTQDTEFEDVEVGVGRVIISRVPQSLRSVSESRFGSGPFPDSRPTRRPGSYSTSGRRARSSGGRSGHSTRLLEAGAAEQRTGQVCSGTALSTP